MLADYNHKLHIGPAGNSYKLNNSKSLTAHEETTSGNLRQKNNSYTKLKLDLQIMPDITEESNKRVAKLSVMLTLENARLEEFECTAITDISLYDREAGDLIRQGREKRKFFAGRVRFLTDLGSQERIEKSANQCLEVGIKVEVQLRRIHSEDRDGYVIVKS